MRGFLCFGWACLLVVCTCIWDLTELTDSSRLSPPVWATAPDWTAFFNGYSLFGEMFLRKVGHFIGFGVLQILFFYYWKRWSASVGAAVSLALLTELAQPLFSRGGRALDVVVDCAGTGAAVLVLLAVQAVRAGIANSKKRALP
ncbi:VanZ family protein [Paenibacillus antri]|nr:VanZ family protein [Paenibacillus antri]